VGQVALARSHSSTKSSLLHESLRPHIVSSSSRTETVACVYRNSQKSIGNRYFFRGGSQLRLWSLAVAAVPSTISERPRTPIQTGRRWREGKDLQL